MSKHRAFPSSTPRPSSMVAPHFISCACGILLRPSRRSLAAEEYRRLGRTTSALSERGIASDEAIHDLGQIQPIHFWQPHLILQSRLYGTLVELERSRLSTSYFAVRQKACLRVQLNSNSPGEPACRFSVHQPALVSLSDTQLVAYTLSVENIALSALRDGHETDNASR